MKYLLKLYKRIREKIWQWEFDMEMNNRKMKEKCEKQEIELAEINKRIADYKKKAEEQYGVNLEDLN